MKITTAPYHYAGNDRVDITTQADGAGQVLAPTWELVAGVKRHLQPDDPRWQQATPLTEAQYTEQYKNLLRARWRYDHQPFIDLVEQGDLTLVCFCTEDEGGHLFCHRQIAADVLTAIAQHVGISADYVGEIRT